MLVSGVVSLVAALAATASAAVPPTNACGRSCLTDLVNEVLLSMEQHNPYTLPMADLYFATENGHPAALGMMTSWRTITKTQPVSLLALDTTQQSAYFALDIVEGNPNRKNILRGRILVVDRQITEMELFINRWRGEHGFSFSAQELPGLYSDLMSPPANRTNPTRAQLESLSAALFHEAYVPENVSSTCQFTELGWYVEDPGTWGNESFHPGCGFPSAHPYDNNARLGLVIDEELGFVVQNGMIPGKVYGYWNVSAFIPDAFPTAQEAQEVWIQEATGILPIVKPFGATGETFEVLQYYNNALQALQINVFLHPPNATSAWLS